ncbi:hypothetical protein [Solicola sp. PLA-1-18]|uniref:hypothetical protein n=1 Tax=Solicola sp. PLA-1-18 TaxID=3380532 RepID=UPI003B80E16D
MAAAGPGDREVSDQDRVDETDVDETDRTATDADDDATDTSSDDADEADAPGADETSEQQADQPAATAAWPEKARAVRLLAAVLVLGVLLGAAGLLAPRLQARADDQGDRSAAVEAATQFVVDINTYDASKVQEYQDRVDPLLTSAYRKEFDALTTQAFTLLAEQKVVSDDARVTGAAVDTIDDDSATVLVAANSSVTTAQQTTPAERPLRWRVELSKSGGDWKVARYDSVASQGADGQAAVPQDGASSATPAPSATPPAPSSGPTTGATP